MPQAEAFRERGQEKRQSPTVQRPEEEVVHESGEDDTLGQSQLTDEGDELRLPVSPEWVPRDDEPSAAGPRVSTKASECAGDPGQVLVWRESTDVQEERR